LSSERFKFIITNYKMDIDRYEIVKDLVVTMIETAKGQVEKQYKGQDAKETIEVMDHIISQLLSLTMNG